MKIKSDLKTEIGQLFAEYKQRAGGDSAAGALLVLAHKVSGLEHWLKKISMKKKKRDKSHKVKDLQLISASHKENGPPQRNGEPLPDKKRYQSASA